MLLTGSWSCIVELGLLLYTASNVAITLYGHGLTGLALGLGCLTIASLALASQTQLTQRLAAIQQAKPASGVSVLHGLLGFPCLLAALSHFNPDLQDACWLVMEGSAAMCMWMLVSAMSARKQHNKKQMSTSSLYGQQSIALHLILPLRAAITLFWSLRQTGHTTKSFVSVGCADMLHAVLSMSGIGTAIALKFVLANLPMTFTLAEAMLVAQGSVLCLWSGMSLLLPISQPNITSQLSDESLTAIRFTAYLAAVVVLLFGTAWTLPIPWRYPAYYRQKSTARSSDKADGKTCERSAGSNMTTNRADTAQKAVQRSKRVTAAAYWLLFVLLAVLLLAPAVAWVLFVFLPGNEGTLSASKQTGFLPTMAVRTLNYFHSVMAGIADRGSDELAGCQQADVLSSSLLQGENNENISQLADNAVPTTSPRTVLQGRLRVLAYWGVLVVASLVLQAWLVKEGSGKPAKFKVPLIIVRKGYHVLALALLVPVLAWDPSMLVVSLAIAFALLMCLELARAKGVPLLGTAVHHFMSRFVDERDDEASMYMTHIALLIGLAGPVWVSYYAFYAHQRAAMEVNKSQGQADGLQLGSTANISMWLVACAGLVSIGIGDAVASVVGKCFGRTRLHSGTKKTWEGTVSSALVMLLCNIWILGSFKSLLALSWQAQLAIAFHTVAAAALEAVTDQLDNLVVPLWACTWMALTVTSFVNPT